MRKRRKRRTRKTKKRTNKRSKRKKMRTKTKNRALETRIRMNKMRMRMKKRRAGRSKSRRKNNKLSNPCPNLDQSNRNNSNSPTSSQNFRVSVSTWTTLLVPSHPTEAAVTVSTSPRPLEKVLCPRFH